MRAPIPFCCVLLATVACGGGGDGGSPAAPSPTPPATPPPAGSTGTPPVSTSSTITVRNNSFDPGDVTVPVGTTVRWTWDACSDDGYGTQTCTPHNVTFDQGGQASVTQSSGAYSRQFATAGTYAYHCTVHGAGMSGRVVVR